MWRRARSRRWTEHRWRARRSRLRRVVHSHPGPARGRRVQRGAGQARHHRPVQGAGRPVADGQLRHRARRRPARHALHLVLPREPDRQRLRPSDRGAAGVGRPRRAAKCSMCVDLGVVPLPDDPGSYYPEDNEPHRHDLKPLDIVQPDGVSYAIDGNLLTWQKWSMRVSMDALEGLVLHQVGVRRTGRSCIARRSARWSCPTATPARCTAGRTRSTPASGASAAWPTPSSSVVTVSARSCTSTGSTPTSTATRPRPRTRSASTKRTTASCGSTSTSTVAAPRCVARGASSCRSSRRSATTSTASTGTSTWTARSSSR